MKPALEQREVLVSGALSVSKFGISQENQVHILTILRDTLYTNKELAVLREYSANAWDANREAGRGDEPIEVILPTELEASLIIRDSGPGLSEEEVQTIYTQYGASTKRSDNVAVGMLGIGSKSAFAYNDAFTITSLHGGTKAVYHAVLDELNVGKVMKMYEGALQEHLEAYVGNPLEVEKDLDGYVDLWDVFEFTGPVEEQPEWNGFCVGWEDLRADAEAKLEALRAEIEDLPEGESKTEKLEALLAHPDSHPARFSFVNRAKEFRLFMYKKGVQLFRDWMAVNHPDTETGITIKVPVRPSDAPKFVKEAKNLFRHFKPLPKINTHINPPHSDWATENGFLTRKAYSQRHESDWIAVMGCVPYRIDMGQVQEELEEAGLTKVVEEMKGGLYFDIGDVSIVANREDLEYKEKTKKAIVERFTALVDDVAVEVAKIIEDESKTQLQRRLELWKFQKRTGLPVTKTHREWVCHPRGVPLYSTRDKLGEDGLPLKTDGGEKISRRPKSFRCKRVMSTHGSRGGKRLGEDVLIPVRSDLRFLIKDSAKPWRGYLDPDYEDRIITLEESYTVAQVEKELSECLREAKLEGVEVVRMSDLTYKTPAERSGTDSNPKHAVDCFKLIGTSTYGAGRSQNWEIASRTPDEDDVYVVINRFVPVGAESLNGDAFFRQYLKDIDILEHLFGETMPTVWGLKTTQRNPVNRDEVEGIEYVEWRSKFFEELLNLNPEIKAHIDALAWTEAHIGTLGGDSYYRGGDEKTETETYKRLKEHLDGRHRVMRFFAEREKARQHLRALRKKLKEEGAKKESTYYRGAEFLYIKALKEFAKDFKPESTEATRRRDTIYKLYPLLEERTAGNDSGLTVLFAGKVRDHWLNYINLVDSARRN